MNQHLCRFAALGSLLALLAMSTAASAATVTFSSLESMTTSTTDAIVRNGDDAIGGLPARYDAAINVGSASNATVNGVNFLGSAPTGTYTQAITANGVTISATVSDTPGGSTPGWGDGADGANRYGPALEDVMESVMVTITEGTAIIRVEFSGLTIGRDYRAQFLMDQSSAGSRNGIFLRADANLTSADSTSFNVGTSGHGESALAFWTADATTAAIVVKSGVNGHRAVLNGVALFHAIPAPAALPAGLGLLAITALRRGRRA